MQDQALNQKQKSQAELADYIKMRCLEAAREGYKHARMSGLCEEGAAEAALSAVQNLSPETLLREFDEASGYPENRDP